jgi:hypothetical protein
MVNKYVGAGKLIFGAGKKIVQKLSGQGKTTGTEVIKSVKPNPQTSDSIHKITLAKIPGQVQRQGMPIMRDLEKTGTALRRTNQKLKGQKVTESGFTKGKDLPRTNKAKGGRIGYRAGTPKKTNVQKIKKTFGPKGLGMQSVIYGLDKNPKITAADPKAKFIAAANKKKKKV